MRKLIVLGVAVVVGMLTGSAIGLTASDLAPPDSIDFLGYEIQLECLANEGAEIIYYHATVEVASPSDVKPLAAVSGMDKVADGIFAKPSDAAEGKARFVEQRVLISGAEEVVVAGVYCPGEELPK